MKNVLSISILALSFAVINVSAQESYKYQPQANKAEYYVDKFKPGKDFDDLLKWGESLVKWTSDNPIYDNWQPNVFMKIYTANLPY